MTMWRSRLDNRIPLPDSMFGAALGGGIAGAMGGIVVVVLGGGIPVGIGWVAGGVAFGCMWYGRRHRHQARP